MFRASVREFAEGELRPRVEQMDEHQKLDPAIIKQCFDLGLMGIETPEEFGGAGSTFFTAILAVEELSRVDASVGVFVDVQNTLVNNAFIRWGTPEQKEKYLTRLASQSVGAYALSEPGSGSDAFAMQTKAVDKGDHYLINGRSFGSQTVSRQRFLCCLPMPIPRPVTGASPPSQWKKAFRVSQLERRRTSLGFVRRRLLN
jgi:alkylation response protein AidB-like acyl-CoA dehydrogenase